MTRRQDHCVADHVGRTGDVEAEVGPAEMTMVMAVFLGTATR